MEKMIESIISENELEYFEINIGRTSLGVENGDKMGLSIMLHIDVEAFEDIITKNKLETEISQLLELDSITIQTESDVLDFYNRLKEFGFDCNGTGVDANGEWYSIYSVCPLDKLNGFVVELVENLNKEKTSV